MPPTQGVTDLFAHAGRAQQIHGDCRRRPNHPHRHHREQPPRRACPTARHALKLPSCQAVGGCEFAPLKASATPADTAGPPGLVIWSRVARCLCPTRACAGPGWVTRRECKQPRSCCSGLLVQTVRVWPQSCATLRAERVRPPWAASLQNSARRLRTNDGRGVCRRVYSLLGASGSVGRFTQAALPALLSRAVHRRLVVLGVTPPPRSSGHMPELPGWDGGQGD